MKNVFAISVLALVLSLTGCSTAGDGVLYRDCTASKAAKGAAMKSTVGIGNGCTPAEAATDNAKRGVR